jgi:hypothetical protein
MLDRGGKRRPFRAEQPLAVAAAKFLPHRQLVTELPRFPYCHAGSMRIAR